jgi:hypothetical protein
VAVAPIITSNVLMSQTILNGYYMDDRYSYDSLNRLIRFMNIATVLP